MKQKLLESGTAGQSKSEVGGDSSRVLHKVVPAHSLEHASTPIGQLPLGSPFKRDQGSASLPFMSTLGPTKLLDSFGVFCFGSMSSMSICLKIRGNKSLVSPGLHSTQTKGFPPNSKALGPRFSISLQNHSSLSQTHIPLVSPKKFSSPPRGGKKKTPLGFLSSSIRPRGCGQVRVRAEAAPGEDEAQQRERRGQQLKRHQ